MALLINERMATITDSPIQKGSANRIFPHTSDRFSFRKANQSKAQPAAKNSKYLVPARMLLFKYGSDQPVVIIREGERGLEGFGFFKIHDCI